MSLRSRVKPVPPTSNERDRSLHRAKHAADCRTGAAAEAASRFSRSLSTFCPRNAPSCAELQGVGNEVADQISNWESIVDLPAELERIRDFGATVITQDSPSYPKSLREIHAPPIVLYVWGELTGARPARHWHHRRATDDALRNRIGQETRLSACLCGIDCDQRPGARDRHRRASGRARRKRQHHRRHRLGIVEILSAGEPRPRGKNLQRQRRGRV